MSKVIYATKDDINDIIASDGVVFVDFFATWCGPCKMLGPTIDKLADIYDNRAKIVKADVDICEEYAIKLGIVSVPTMKIFKNGVLVDTLVGLVPQAKIQMILDSHID